MSPILGVHRVSNFYLCINGICTPTDDASDWQYRAVEYIQQGGYGAAEAYCYYCWAVTRFIRQGHRINAVEDILERNEPAYGKTCIIAHSNGAEIAVKALAKFDHLYVDELHLVAGACDADFNSNGLNLAASRGQIKNIFIYASSNDRALLAAAWSKRLVGWLGLGYGDLGRVGPKGMSLEAKAITRVIWNNENDHGDWLGKNFARTMAIITRGGGA